MDFQVKDGTGGGQSFDERLMAIHAMRAEGLTLQVIGDTFGVTRERIRQLLVMSNGPTAEQVRDYRRRLRENEQAARQEQLIGWLRDHPGASMQEAGSFFGWSESDLATAVTPAAHRLAVQARDGAAYRQYDDQDAFRALRQAWSLTEGSAKGLSWKRYQDLVDSGQVSGPSAQRIMQVYRTWRRATDLAGIPSGGTGRGSYSSTWTDGEVLDFVVRCLSDPSSSGTYAGYDAWRRNHAPDAPSSGILRLRLGSWSKTKALALASAASKGAPLA